ncbi:MAG: hypothetical protein HOP14_07475, partial [Acidobacteria bacterium]|nr:hypothetical protein [Acidobacteriota bacterium]
PVATALVPGQLGGAVATGVTAFLVGAGTGIAALSIGTGFSIPLGEWLNGPASSDDIRNVWLLLLPAVFGLAFAVARRDGRMLFRGDSTMTWRGKLAMGLLVVHVFAGAGWVFGLAEQTIDLIGGPPMLRVSENLDAAKDFVEDPTAKVRRRELDLSSVPAAVTLTLASPAPIRVTLPSDLPTDFVLLFYEIPSDGLGTPRLVGLQRQDSSERFYRFRDDPPTLGQVRGEPADVEQLKPPPGTYAIVADTFTEWSAARSGSNGSLGAQLSTAQIYDRAMSRLTWSRLRTWFRQTPGTEEQQRAVVAVSSVAPYRLVVEIETDRAAEVEASIRSNPVYREALDASNARSLTQAEIDEIDGRWRDGDAAVIQSVQSRNCSLALASLKNDIGGLVEVFITDRRGVNVCQSNTTSDYYQADEVWWQNTRESRAAYTGPVEFDESVGGNAQAVHLPVLDPDDPDGDIIGIVRAVLRAEQQPVTEQLRPAPAP